MTLPAFLYGSVIALLIGAVFHLWRGGGLTHVILYLFISVVGFWVGHLVAFFWNLQFWFLGPIRFGAALIGSLAFLFLASWLSQVRTAKEPK
jgi:hypothetical protein